MQCDGRPIPLPSLQGIAVLNIPSFAGGTNFWGGTKEDDVSSFSIFFPKNEYQSSFLLFCAKITISI